MKGPGAGLPGLGKAPQMAGGNSASGARSRHRGRPSASLRRPKNHLQRPHREVPAHCDWLSQVRLRAGAGSPRSGHGSPAPLVRMRAIPAGKRLRASGSRPAEGGPDPSLPRRPWRVENASRWRARIAAALKARPPLRTAGDHPVTTPPSTHTHIGNSTPETF